MKDIKTIEDTVGAALEANGAELVDLIVQSHNRKKVLQFFVDKEGGVNLNDCEILSKQIDSVLEMENLIDGAYILEVSSPGYNRALKKPAHFKKFINERAKIFLKKPVENRGFFTGVIADADEEKIVLDDGTSKYTFKYEDIKKASLDPVVEF